MGGVVWFVWFFFGGGGGDSGENGADVYCWNFDEKQTDYEKN